MSKVIMISLYLSLLDYLGLGMIYVIYIFNELASEEGCETEWSAWL
jgi:hypothetical protein